jgi:inhibitor of KinA
MARPPKPLGVVPLGDCAAYVEFAQDLDLEVNSLCQRLAAALHARRVPWIRDVVPALGGVGLHFDPDHPDAGGDALKAVERLVEDCLKGRLPDIDDVVRTVDVPVCYDPEFAPDLQEVSRQTQLPESQIISLHAAAEYRVLMIGFAPGHAYMGGLDKKLAVPRRASPRALVPAGSVAIANRQTVVYPYAISGGWSVIGRTPLAVFEAGRPEPSLFAAGDRVRFRPITKKEFLEY